MIFLLDSWSIAYPLYLRMQPYLKKFLQCNQVKMRSYWIGVGPTPMTGVLIKRGKFGHRDTQT